jgi:hypothetical protein
VIVQSTPAPLTGAASCQPMRSSFSTSNARTSARIAPENPVAATGLAAIV